MIHWGSSRWIVRKCSSNPREEEVFLDRKLPSSSFPLFCFVLRIIIRVSARIFQKIGQHSMIFFSGYSVPLQCSSLLSRSHNALWMQPTIPPNLTSMNFQVIQIVEVLDPGISQCQIRFNQFLLFGSEIWQCPHNFTSWRPFSPPYLHIPLPQFGPLNLALEHMIHTDDFYRYKPIFLS